MPEDDPDRDGDHDGQPQALAHGAAHVAHRMALAAELRRHHRRRRDHQAEAEDQRNEIEVRAERAGGDGVRPEPAHHQHVGRGHGRLAEIGQNHRPAELQHGADFRAPRIFRSARPGLDRRHVLACPFAVLRPGNAGRKPQLPRRDNTSARERAFASAAAQTQGPVCRECWSSRVPVSNSVAGMYTVR